jgi:hypothetical protein
MSTASWFNTIKKLGGWVLLAGITYCLWCYTPIGSWVFPQQANNPTSTGNTALNPEETPIYREQTKIPLAQFPAKLQPLEKNWRTQLKKAIAKGLFGENVAFKISDLAHKQWQMTTSDAIYFEDNSGGAFLKAVDGTLLNAQGQAVGAFKAPYGVYNAKTQVIHLQGGIQFRGTTAR